MRLVRLILISSGFFAALAADRPSSAPLKVGSDLQLFRGRLPHRIDERN